MKQFRELIEATDIALDVLTHITTSKVEKGDVKRIKYKVRNKAGKPVKLSVDDGSVEGSISDVELAKLLKSNFKGKSATLQDIVLCLRDNGAKKK